MVGIRHIALFAGVILPSWALPLTEKRGAEIVSGKYIVTLKPGVESAAVDSHIDWVNDVHARSLSRRASGINKVYSISGFNGYSGSFDEATVAQIKNDDKVASVEPDMVWMLSELATQSNAPWGLGSISHRTKQHTDYIYDSSAGEGTYAYIIDTGLMTEHVEFEGRASLGYNAFPNTEFVDHHGHGTHTAGTVGSRAYGVAKKASLISVKVFDTGSSTTEIVLDGYNWAVNNITATPGRAAVSAISMSLGGPQSDAFNAAVEAAYQAGVLTVVAAGNDGSDASDVSPASAPNAVTVGAVDINDTMAYFSNYGALVDIFAPGVDVLSCYIGAPNATAEFDGTSMATPHVAGVALYLKALYPGQLASPGAVTERLLQLGTRDEIQSLAANTTNLMLYNGNGA